MQVSYIVMATWVLLFTAAAISDLRSFRIPNYLSALLIMLFVVTFGLAGFTASLWENLLHFMVALIAGMIMFSLGWIGGGDAKLYAAAALWFNWVGAITLVFATTIAGLVLVISFVAARMLGFRKDVPKQDRRIPYGVAIAAGAVLSASWQGWEKIFPTIS